MSRIKPMLVALLLMTVLLPLSQAQESNLGNWLVYIGSKKIGQKLIWHHEVQYRNYNAIGDLEQLLLRTGLGYNLSEGNNNILLGYGFIRSANYTGIDLEKVNVDEHRIFQQFTTKQSFGRFSVAHRYRLEERFVSDDFKVRFRYFAAVKLALSNKTIIDKTLYLSGYNEIFVNAKQEYFDRNRIYGGLGFRLNKNLTFELGYMNQILNGKTRDQINMICFAKF